MKALKKNKKYTDAEVLAYLARTKKATGGNTPTIAKIVREMGMTSNSVASYRLERLVKSGWLIRLDGGPFRLTGDEYFGPGELKRIPLTVLQELVRVAKSAAAESEGELLSIEVILDAECREALRRLIIQHPDENVRFWAAGELGIKESEEPCTPQPPITTEIETTESGSSDS